MNRTQAHEILNAARLGFAVKAEDIHRALQATGDLSLIFVKGDGRINANPIGPCRQAVSLYLQNGGTGNPKQIAAAIGFPVKATEHALRKLRLAGSPFMAQVHRVVVAHDKTLDIKRKAPQRLTKTAIRNRTPLELAWAA